MGIFYFEDLTKNINLSRDGDVGDCKFRSNSIMPS
jgi:hypothetical protein